MPNRVAISTLNASTLDILNTIRSNANSEYQSLVPEIKDVRDIPKVGEVLYGYPALANQFINALINRIALVRIKSATFNNAYSMFKKGYLEFGETVEEVFVCIAKAREFSVEKAAAREFKRTIPDVKTALHVQNYRAQYPVTVQQEDLRMAFQSMDGVQDLIAKIVDSVYVAAEYDEFLLFKYLMIKAITHGKMYPVGVDTSDMKNAAKKFRSISNGLTFMNTKYNAKGVHTTTAKEDQYIFMDSEFNASYDVDVLAAAFNMDRATFSGKLQLIDKWDEFDNERFDVIRENSDQLEEVTDAELALMKNVKAVLLDGEWFQVYDNLTLFSEDYVAAGLYWNYFLNIWKTISSSPFSNAVVFVEEDESEITQPDTFTVEVTAKSVCESATVLTLTPQADDATLAPREFEFLQTEGVTEEGIAVHKYGAIIIPANAETKPISFSVKGIVYTNASGVVDTLDVGDTVTFTRNDFVDDTLASLSMVGVTLTPTFAKGTTTYTGAVSADTSVATFAATDENATVVAKVGTTAIDSGDTITWAAGENTVTIDVTGFVGGEVSTKQYKVVVTKS